MPNQETNHISWETCARNCGGYEPAMAAAGSRSAGLVGMQPDGMGDLIEFLAGNILQTFAGHVELLINLDDFFGHDLVSLPGTAHQDEILTGGHPFVAV